MSEINIKSIEDQIKEESKAQERALNDYVDRLLKEAPDLTDDWKAVASQMKADRTAQMKADVAKAKEEAAAKVSEEYRNKYGDSSQDNNKGYKELLKGLL